MALILHAPYIVPKPKFRFFPRTDPNIVGLKYPSLYHFFHIIWHCRIGLYICAKKLSDPQIGRSSLVFFCKRLGNFRHRLQRLASIVEFGTIVGWRVCYCRFREKLLKTRLYDVNFAYNEDCSNY